MVLAKFFIPLLLLGSACLVSSLTARRLRNRQQALWNPNDQQIVKNGGGFLLDNELTEKDGLALSAVMTEMNKGKDKYTLCDAKTIADFTKCYCGGWVAVANQKIEYNFVFRMNKGQKPVNMFIQASSGTDMKSFTSTSFSEFAEPYECRQPSMPEEKKQWARFSGFSNILTNPNDKEAIAGLNLKEKCLQDINKKYNKQYNWIVKHNPAARTADEIKKNVDTKNIPACWKKVNDITYWMIVGLTDNTVQSNFLCILNAAQSIVVKLAPVTGDSDLPRVPSPNAKKK